MQTVVKQATSQSQTTTSSKQESITVSSVMKAFSSYTSLTKTTTTTTQKSSQRVAIGKVPKTPTPSVDFDTISSPEKPERKNSLVQGTSNANFKKIPKAADPETAIKKPKPKPEFGVQIPHKSPLPERSTKLKEVPIPQVPTAATPAATAVAPATTSTTTKESAMSSSAEALEDTTSKPTEEAQQKQTDTASVFSGLIRQGNNESI